MKRKKLMEYITLLFIFLIFLFRNSINSAIISFNKDFKIDSICVYENSDAIKKLKELEKVNNIASTSYNYNITKIKYRDILDFKNELVIYKGTSDNIKKGSAVITNEGLVGIIKSTEKNTSIVRLITSKDSNISVRINESYGILKKYNDKLIVSNLTNYANVNVGDKIYTSGIGNLPGEIYVGTVKNVIMNDLKIEKIVEVESLVDFDSLIYVAILEA